MNAGNVVSAGHVVNAANAAAMDCRRVNGSDAERCYLESLNICFPGWGGRELFDWCFSRESAGLRPDLMMLHDAGRAVAGLANAYRRIRLPNGHVMLAGLMIGAWTLPEARGRGAFTRLIGESIECGAARHAGLLLAFFAHTNPSAGRMRAAGAALFPSWHIRSVAERRMPADDGTRADAYVEDGSDGTIGDVIADADAVRLVYTADEWRDQFLRRPNPVTRVLSRGNQQSPWSALVERTAAFDRVLSLTFSEPSGSDDDAWVDAIAVLDARAAAAGRRVFIYTTDERQAAAARSRGFEIIDGYVSALVANQAILRAVYAAGGNGHGKELPPAPSPSTSHLLADPASPWYLGRLFVRNGDRM